MVDSVGGLLVMRKVVMGDIWSWENLVDGVFVMGKLVNLRKGRGLVVKEVCCQMRLVSSSILGRSYSALSQYCL